MKKILFAIAVSITFLSCIKEVTPGATGARGPQGPPGKDGTQINTYYVSVQPNQWKDFGVFDSTGYYCYVEESLSAITPAVIDNGAILVYVIVAENGQDYDHQLPYMLPFYVGGYFTRVIHYDLQPGKIGFVVQDSDFKTPLPPFNGTVQFKVVIISKI